MVQETKAFGLGETTTIAHRPRVLLAKIGLDGHDRGVKVLARSFRDAGIEVIYTGLWQTCEATMHAALQEDVDIVGVSLLSAAHMTVMPAILRIGKELGVGHIPVVLGGIVPVHDSSKLKEMGVAEVFNPGSPLDKIVETMRRLSSGRESPDIDEVLAGYARRDPQALSTLITAVQREESPTGWAPPAGNAVVIGVTGAPGVGKSSLIGRLGKRLRDRGKKVAVVAIDPSSPVTGGALLGDRLRMMTGQPDEWFFIRSLASGDVQGGLAPHCRDVVNILNGFGFDYVLVETVGAGQADVAIRNVSDRTLLVLMPESGDAIQFSKAGIVEIADAFVLNKCDLSGADATEAQLRSAVGHSRPLWRVSTVRDEGIDAVADWVTSL
jgi:LAO/AO transport system ATPase